MFNEKLRGKREELGISQRQFAKNLGIGADLYNKYEQGVSRPSHETLVLIAKGLGCTVDYLLGNAPLPNYRFYPNELDDKKGIRIPVLGRIPAGIPIEAIEDIEDYEEIPAAWLRGGREYFALRIRGNSMYPKYQEDDIVIFLKTDDCDSGAECAVIVNGNDATFKKILKQKGGIALQPLNTTDYEPEFYSNNEIKKLPLRILGTAKEIRRKA
ncbi:MAG: XRE family transcriptional regulator [Oscillospiraceae bacterium]|nr:XRE family transcriptional regulator [Oscillospiraceae bacterium]